MKPIKIKVHSSVDLITNSSTTIFTFSEGSVDAVKELVNEMLKVFNEPYKKFDDIFYAGVFAEYYDCYDENDEEVYVKFLNGSVYVYRGVPLHDFEGLRDTPSVGSYLHRNFKNIYPYERIE